MFVFGRVDLYYFVCDKNQFAACRREIRKPLKDPYTEFQTTTADVAHPCYGSGLTQ